MTIFSLGNACDLEHFSNNTKMNTENFDMPNYEAPVVPMPTEPPNPSFGNTNYQWKSNSSAVQQMTNRGNSNSFQPSIGRDSTEWGSVNFGQDYWGENTDSYSFSNKLLTNNMDNGKFQSDKPEMVMPNMRPQSTYMPPQRSHIVKNEDESGRPKRRKMKPVVEIVEEPQYPELDINKIENDQKNVWIMLIAVLIIILGYIMHHSNYF